MVLYILTGDRAIWLRDIALSLILIEWVGGLDSFGLLGFWPSFNDDD